MRLVNNGTSPMIYEASDRFSSLRQPVEEKITPIWNTFGVIPGHIKDEVVVLGNHRDGMCYTLE